MTGKLILNVTVAYGDVDRHEVMLLPRIFKMLQDAAIVHADQYGTGAEARTTSAQTWVLNRIAAAIDRYPKPGEALRVETWSTGIKGFKGYRDFRVYDSAGAVVIAASSLWLYVDAIKKSIVRVPREIATSFPIGPEPAWCAELEELPFDPPGNGSTVVPVTLRFSDFDVNEHVNNAAYLDLVQTALARSGRKAHPIRIEVKFSKAIPLPAESVMIRLESNGSTSRFGIEGGGVVFAAGSAAE